MSPLRAATRASPYGHEAESGDGGADVLEGELRLGELAGGEVDGAERVEDGLLVAAQVAGLFAVVEGALEILELEARLGDVEVGAGVLRVDGDQRLELLARAGPVLLAGGDHGQAQICLGEGARLLSGRRRQGGFVGGARVVEAVELEERLAPQDEEGDVALLGGQAVLALLERRGSVASPEERVGPHPVLRGLVDARPEQQERHGERARPRGGGRSGGRHRAAV